VPVFAEIQGSFAGYTGLFCRFTQNDLAKKPCISCGYTKRCSFVDMKGVFADIQGTFVGIPTKVPWLFGRCIWLFGTCIWLFVGIPTKVPWLFGRCIWLFGTCTWLFSRYTGLFLRRHSSTFWVSAGHTGHKTSSFCVHKTQKNNIYCVHQQKNNISPAEVSARNMRTCEQNIPRKAHCIPRLYPRNIQGSFVDIPGSFADFECSLYTAVISAECTGLFLHLHNELVLQICGIYWA